MNIRSTLRTLVCCGAVLVAAVAARGSVAAPLTILDTADPRPHQVRQLHDDIALANLILGLNLTGDQLDGLADLAARADEARANHEAEHVDQLAEMDAAFCELREHLLSSGEVPPPVKAQARQAETAHKALKLELQQDLAELEAEARALLDDGQIQIVEEFKPCLFPPEDLSSPLRVGQTGASTHLVEKLDEIRQLPQNTYERHLSRFLDRAMDRVQWHEGPISEEEQQIERERITALLERVRGMDDLTWAVEGEAMAEQLVAPLKRDMPAVNPRSELTRVGMLLLAPGAADVIGSIAGRG